jgi:hypothetical protein
LRKEKVKLSTYATLHVDLILEIDGLTESIKWNEKLKRKIGFDNIMNNLADGVQKMYFSPKYSKPILSTLSRMVMSKIKKLLRIININ